MVALDAALVDDAAVAIDGNLVAVVDLPTEFGVDGDDDVTHAATPAIPGWSRPRDAGGGDGAGASSVRPRCLEQAAEPVFERDARFEVEQSTGARDVGPAPVDVAGAGVDLNDVRTRVRRVANRRC